MTHTIIKKLKQKLKLRRRKQGNVCSLMITDRPIYFDNILFYFIFKEKKKLKQKLKL